jgi:uncharacterized protein YndB with AHSA1/START domain
VSDRGEIECDAFVPHAPDLVWRALTEPALVARWWTTGDIRPVVGHRFTLDMGQLGSQPCEVVAVEPARVLSLRFGEVALDSTITFTLVPEGTGTRLLLVQRGFDLDSPFGKHGFETMEHGWPIVLSRMGPALTTSSVDP